MNGSGANIVWYLIGGNIHKDQVSSNNYTSEY